MKIKAYILTAFVTLCIVVLSTIPIPENPPLGDVPLMDKWVHMVMYGGLMLVMWVDHAVRNRRKFSWMVRVIMLAYATVLGGAMELVQAHLTTCRSGDWIDFEADVVGAIAAALCLIYIDKLWREKILVRK